ncbi:MAG: ADP-ribosylglycohydrolase family protein [Thermodesulfovibrionales bacterium]|nr:ADP-ribosylglycohydrolase family protein [Thermodesulfovibrionales bacterium]
MTEISDRFRGSLLGLAVGDALGAPVEGLPPWTFTPVSGMHSGGLHEIEAGQWTDDTSMALCLAESLIERGGHDPQDQLRRYVMWLDEGHLTSRGRAFGIGSTVYAALEKFKRRPGPYCGPTDPRSAGNGSLMRLAPVPLFYCRDPEKAMDLSGDSSRTTHGAQAAVDACRYFGGLIAGALMGAGKEELLSACYSPVDGYYEAKPLVPEVEEVARGSYKSKGAKEIRASAYVVESLEAALWAFYNSEGFSEAVLMAVNLGHDADTTAAICGTLAGAHYGVGSIPDEWLSVLAHREVIEALAHRLFEATGPFYT